MPLEEYYKKREFRKTPEPKGEIKEIGQHRFVIHQHQARHLHYDFRLELPENASTKPSDPKEGIGFWVLKSWAVPKEPPTAPGIKRLAVQVEDHPVDYITFEGKIPEDQYGAGTVKIWDSGKFNLIERRENEIEFELLGEKLKGNYLLLRTKMGGNPRNWLLFKSHE